MSEKMSASISLDLDNLWSYMKTHGSDGWESRPSYYDVFVPHMLEVLDRLDQHVPDADVMVIDDASTDDTRAIVRARLDDHPNLRLVERATKNGLGDAYLHAFRIGLDEGYEALVEIDADLSHDPAVLPTMAANRAV
mgnify:CR=1 FL=1